MARHLVCLTFDFDNTSSAIARGQTTPTMLSRGDFGVVGAARILELLKRHSIPSTWFIPGHTIESYPDACRAVVQAGHEIAHHGWTHRVPASLTREEEAAELERGNAAIEAITGRRARGYRSPAWELSPWSIDLLLERGFLYDSSLMGDDYLPYQARVGDAAELEQPLRFGQDSPLVEMPISWSLDDYPVFEYSRSPTGILPGLMNAGLVLENWLADFRYMAAHLDWGVITYTFHPHVIGRGHRMLMLEALIDQLTDLGAAFVAMEDAVAEYRERWPAGRSWGA
jgi:peptidoglycan/xylan/chitin deacetylase (PgdA/CDA1 family)